MLISIVIPCYNSEHTLPKVVGLIREEFEKLEEYDYELVLVNDCSSDGTFETIRALGAEDERVHGVSLMRNFGQHNALMWGMDDDMQTHPSQIKIILNKMKEGFDIVYGVYAESTNGAFKNFTSWFNRKSSQVLLGRPKDIHSSNFWCITSAVKDEVIRCGSFSPYVDGLFYRTSHKIGNVEIEHHKREYGSSGYSLRKIMKLWLAYFNYSVIPLRIASIIGLITAACGFIAGLGTIIYKLVDPTIPMGWASIICIQLFLAGMILFVLGIMGEYIGDAVLMLNGTPQFIVREKVNL